CRQSLKGSAGRSRERPGCRPGFTRQRLIGSKTLPETELLHVFPAISGISPNFPATSCCLDTCMIYYGPSDAEHLRAGGRPLDRKGGRKMENVKDFLKRKDIVITPQRYLIEALGAMAQGLFASLLMGTILNTLGQQLGVEMLITIGGYASAMSGPAMACAIGCALHAPNLVLFSLVTVGWVSNSLGGAG